MSTRAKSQRGAVLVVGLVMLLLLTLIGMAAMRSSTMQERMVGNMRDHNLAFQAAEAGLRAGEDFLDGSGLPSFAGSVPGYGGAVAQPGSVEYWRTTFDWANNSVQLVLGLTDVASQPRYFIERIKQVDSESGVDVESVRNLSEAYIYRVTSRAEGGSVNSVSILQSTYRPK